MIKELFKIAEKELGPLRTDVAGRDVEPEPADWYQAWTRKMETAGEGLMACLARESFGILGETLFQQSTMEIMTGPMGGRTVFNVRYRPDQDYFRTLRKPLPKPLDPKGCDAVGIELGLGVPARGRKSGLRPSAGIDSRSPGLGQRGAGGLPDAVCRVPAGIPCPARGVPVEVVDGDSVPAGGGFAEQPVYAAVGSVSPGGGRRALLPPRVWDPAEYGIPPGRGYFPGSGRAVCGNAGESVNRPG